MVKIACFLSGKQTVVLLSRMRRAGSRLSDICGLLSRNSTSGYIGSELMSILSKYVPGITYLSYKELYKTKRESMHRLRLTGIDNSLVYRPATNTWSSDKH